MSEIDLGPGIKILPEEDIKSVIKSVFHGLSDVKESYLAYIKENKERFERFISPGKSIKDKTFSFLSILRKWNSYTPVLPPKGGTSKGGGYFLYHNGIGIVIDPGFNFIQNFFEQNFKIDDIDAILVTHAHNDHTVEFESIFSLLYKRNKNLSEDAHKKIDVYLNLGSFKKFASFFDLSHKNYPNYIRNIVLLDSHNEYKVPKDNWEADITIFTTKAQHHEIITCTYALGFIIKCGDKIIRFTGDTGWNPKIEDENQRLMDSKQLDKIDILITHLGSIEDSEFNFNFEKAITENIQEKVFYEQHLGILGCICMMHKYRPELTIFSEFGEELKAIRKDLISKISKAMEMYSIPGDIGLYIKLDDLSIFCSKSGLMVPKDAIEVHETKDDLLCYISKNSFSPAEMANKQETVYNLERKIFSSVISVY